MKKTVCIILALLMSFTAFAGGLPTIGSGGTGSMTQSGGYNSTSGKSVHTLMLYMVGSNLESEYGEASSALKQIANCGANFNSLNVVVAAGGANAWWELSVGAGETCFGSVRRQSNGSIGLQWDQRNRGSISDKNMLANFLNYAYTNYPAEHYTLVLWDHGGGPLVGFGHDEVSDSILSLSDMADGLKLSPFAGRKLDMLVFDACLMGSYEVAVALSPYADYMVASEEVTYGINYEFLGGQNGLCKSVYSMGKDICDLYGDWCSRRGHEYGYALINLSRLSNINSVLKAIFGNDFTKQDLADLAKAAYYSKAFGVTGSNSVYDLYDLHEFCANISYMWGGDTNTILWMVDNPVEYIRTNISGAHGLSFFYPLYYSARQHGGLEVFEKFNVNREYASFVKSVSQGQYSYTPTRAMDSGVTRAVMPGHNVSEEGAVYTYQMTSEQQEEFVRASYVLLSPAEDGGYDLVRGGFGVFPDENGLLTAVISSDITVTEDGQYITVIEKERTESEIRYFLPFMLERGEKIQLVNSQYTVKDGEGKLGDIVPNTSTGLAPRVLLSYEPGDWVCYQILRYMPVCDESGAIRPFSEWTLSENVYASGFTVTEANEVTVMQVPADDKEYYVQINGVLIDGSRFCSELMPLVRAE